MQVVNIDGHLSSRGKVTSGVPQGSSLGPLLFLIHISDIDINTKHSIVSSFADDTRVSKLVNDEEDHHHMQQDLGSIYIWADENNMSFNPDKFEILSYGPPKINPVPYLTQTGSHIKEVDVVKDLGVQMQNTGKFTQHMSDAIKRGSNLAGWILRVFRTRDRLAMVTLFRSLVIPHLEYCCQLWSPHLMGDIQKLEAVQRSFTARISGIGHLSYWERLTSLKLYSLERRRERYQILYIYKIIQKLVPNLSDERFKITTIMSVRGNRDCKIPAINNRATARVRTLTEHSFAIQGPKLFNSLSPEIRNFDGSFDVFKRKLDRFLCTIPDQPCIPGYHQSVVNNSIITQLAQMRAEGVFV